MGSAALGFYIGHRLEHQIRSADNDGPALELVAPDVRPAFTLPDTAGESRSIQEWDGKVLVVNFWATWCPPCREEIPEFIALQKKYASRGLQFVGIAIDETEAVLPFVQEVGVNYPILLGQLSGIDLSREYGNRWGALPFTAVVDRQGRIVSIKGGALTGHELEQKVLPYL